MSTRSQLPLNKRIYVAGHRGMVGGAIVRRLASLGFDNIITKTHAEIGRAHV